MQYRYKLNSVLFWLFLFAVSDIILVMMQFSHFLFHREKIYSSRMLRETRKFLIERKTPG